MTESFYTDITDDNEKKIEKELTKYLKTTKKFPD